LQVRQVEVLLLSQSEDSAGGAHNNVRGLHSLEYLDVVSDGQATVEDLSLHLRQVLSESGELILDLVCELTGVTDDESRAGLGVFWQLMQNCQNKYSGLSHTRFGLAEDVHSNHSMRDAFLLYL
jgi:hypothetical protein